MVVNLLRKSYLVEIQYPIETHLMVKSLIFLKLKILFLLAVVGYHTEFIMVGIENLSCCWLDSQRGEKQTGNPVLPPNVQIIKFSTSCRVSTPTRSPQ